MVKKDQNFEDFISSVKFDDKPDNDHKAALEKKLLDAYDNRANIKICYKTPEVDVKTQTYLFRIGLAASFILIAALLALMVNSIIKPKESAHQIAATQTQQKTIDVIYENEKKDGTTKTQITDQLKKVWALAHTEDANGLISLMTSNNIAAGVKRYASKYVAEFGNEQTLATLNSYIELNSLTDPNDPLVVAARKLREKLGVDKQQE